MTIAMDFYKSIYEYLQVTSELLEASRTGPSIEVKESFTMLVKIKNAAPPVHRKKGVPNIVFRNVVLNLKRAPGGDPYVEPIQMSDVPPAVLKPGEEILLTAKMVARRAIDDEEQIAAAWVTGDLDQDEFFIFRKKYLVMQNLNP